MTLPHYSSPPLTMPFPRHIPETLFRASVVFLLVIVIPFTTMAIPVITQEFARAPTPPSVASVKLTHKEIFDIVFAICEQRFSSSSRSPSFPVSSTFFDQVFSCSHIVLFLFIIGTFARVGGFPFPPFAAVDCDPPSSSSHPGSPFF